MKLCECGCGEPAPLARKTDRKRGYIAGEPKSFVHGHRARIGDFSGRTLNTGYVMVKKRDHHRANRLGYVLEHVLIAERALGRPLRKGHPTHHVDGGRANNGPGNLVICEDQAYHMLLHQRQRALADCGNANWRKCVICKEYDDAAKLRSRPGVGQAMYHAACAAAYARGRRGRRQMILAPQYIRV